MSDLVAILRSAALAIALLLVVGLSIDVRLTMPDHAPVYLDHASKTFFPVPCLAQWEARSTSDPAAIKTVRAVDAYESGYRPDETCEQAGLHGSESRNLTGTALEFLGILPKRTYWWDEFPIKP